MENEIKKIFDSITTLKNQVANAMKQIDAIQELFIQKIITEKQMKFKIVHTGNFLDFYLKSIMLIALSICTLGIAFPFYIYWSMKYFIINSEIRNESNP